MVNLEVMRQLLDRGIDPALLNEVLRRELAEVAPKVAQASAQTTLDLPLTPPRWTPEAEVKPYMAKLKAAYAITQKARHDAGSMAGGGHVRVVYRLAAEMPSIASMQSMVRDAVFKAGGRARLAQQIGTDSAAVIAWLTGARAPMTHEAEALSKLESPNAGGVVVMCARACLVIATYRKALGMEVVRTRNKKGE